MIKKPEGYDEAREFTGEYEPLPAGAYVCVIKQASEVHTQAGRPQIAILFDIAEGEKRGFYAQMYDDARRTSSDPKWKGVHKQTMDGTSLPFFKGLMSSIEKSNPGYSFPWGLEGNEKTLVGKKFGALMGREQFRAQNGDLRWATKVVQVRSVDGLKDAKIPEDKYLQEDAMQAASNHPFVGQPGADGFMNIPDGINDDELPFN